MFVRSLAIAMGVTALIAARALAADASAGPAWSMNATAIEACSCPMFCQCYFNAAPAAHGGHEGHEGHEAEHFCRFNNAYKINKGTYGSTKLDGAMFWIYGDLGGDFSQNQMDWAVVTFDKKTTPEQRKGITEICGKLFPVKWNSLTTAEGAMTWVPGKDEAYALLDDGKTAEIRLTAANLNRNAKAEPIVMKNLKYWGAPRNDGFIMMPNTIEAVRVGDKPFEFKGTNGFLITVDMNSKDFMAASTH